MGTEYFEGTVYKVTVKSEKYDLIKEGPPLTVVPDPLFYIAGTDVFRQKVHAAFKQLTNIRSGKNLLAEVAELLIRKNMQLLFYEDKVSKFTIEPGELHKIAINPDTTEYDMRNGLGNKPLIVTVTTTMAHELEHSRQYLLKKEKITTPCSNGENDVTTYSDVLAVRVENLVRKELQLPERTHYEGVNVYQKKLSGNFVEMVEEKNGKYREVESSDRYNVGVTRKYIYLLEPDTQNLSPLKEAEKTVRFTYRTEKVTRRLYIPRIKRGSTEIVLSYGK